MCTKGNGKMNLIQIHQLLMQQIQRQNENQSGVRTDLICLCSFGRCVPLATRPPSQALSNMHAIEESGFMLQKILSALRELATLFGCLSTSPSSPKA